MGRKAPTSANHRPSSPDTAILFPPPGHPGAVAVGGRGGRVGFKAELLGRFGDAVDEEILVLVVAVLAHDGAELGQVASIERTRMRSLRPSKRLTHTAVCVTSERLSFLFRRGTLCQRVKGMHVRTLRDGYSRAVPYRGAARERGRELGQVVATLSLISPRLNLLIADRIIANETIIHVTPRDTKPPNHHQRNPHEQMLDRRPRSPTRANQSNRARAAMASYLAPEPPQQASRGENDQDGG